MWQWNRRYGDITWSQEGSDKLKYMLTAAIQRRFPRGLRVHVQVTSDKHTLASLTQAWRQAGLWITRAKVRSFASEAGAHTFYLLDEHGNLPDPAKVQAACDSIGGCLRPQGELLSGSNGSNASGRGSVELSAAQHAAAAGKYKFMFALSKARLSPSMGAMHKDGPKSWS